MKIEILFPELCNLYGDRGNIKYLKECIKDAEVIKTSLNDEPAFVNEEVSLIFMCSMTEKSQERIIEKLLKYKEKLNELINNGTCFLLTGNSFEIFGNYIETEDKRKIEGLGLLNCYSKRYIPNRFNSLFLGQYKDYNIVGYTSRFSHTFFDNTPECLFKVTKGLGINPEADYEGFRVNNLFATYLLGPLLVENPNFTKELLELIGVKDAKLAFEKEIFEAYKIRENEYQKDIKLS